MPLLIIPSHSFSIKNPFPSILQVDSWIDFCAHEIELPATIWCYPVIGYMPYNDAAVCKAKEDLKIALGALEAALVEKTYLVRKIQALLAFRMFGRYRFAGIGGSIEYSPGGQKLSDMTPIAHGLEISSYIVALGRGVSEVNTAILSRVYERSGTRSPWRISLSLPLWCTR